MSDGGMAYPKDSPTGGGCRVGCIWGKGHSGGVCMVQEPPDVPQPDAKAARIAFLERKRLVTIEDTKLKLEGEDWHGVADGAMDLRDIDNELDGLRF